VNSTIWVRRFLSKARERATLVRTLIPIRLATGDLDARWIPPCRGSRGDGLDRHLRAPVEAPRLLTYYEQTRPVETQLFLPPARSRTDACRSARRQCDSSRDLRSRQCPRAKIRSSSCTTSRRAQRCKCRPSENEMPTPRQLMTGGRIRSVCGGEAVTLVAELQDYDARPKFVSLHARRC